MIENGAVAVVFANVFETDHCEMVLSRRQSRCDSARRSQAAPDLAQADPCIKTFDSTGRARFAKVPLDERGAAFATVT
jgi:hypothetical protein